MQGWRENLKALGFSLVIHLVVIGFVVLTSWEWPTFDRDPPPIQVSLADMGPIAEQRRAEEDAERAEEMERLQEEAAAEAAREEEIRQAAEQARQEREQEQREEQQRLAEEEAERQRQAEEEARQERAEQQRREEAEEQARREEQQRQEEERAAREAEQRRLEEERQRELEELQRQREEARRELEEQERRLEELAEQRRQEEQQREQRLEEERLRLAAAEAAEEGRRATLREEYISTISELVRRNWTRPPTTRPGVECDVRIFQIPGGEIISAEIASPCNADEATRRSIINAVNRVEELPYRGYEDVFSREIVFEFRYEG